MALSPNKSDFFHFLRWVSALFVLVGHLPMVYSGIFKDVKYDFAMIYVANHAHSAVILFFILSGYVIAYSVNQKMKTNLTYGFKEYFSDRWSRIYSVLIPAIILTIVLDLVGKSISSFYSSLSIFPKDNLLLRIFVNLFSLQGTWGNRVQLGSNPALWSIGYEFTFYIIYGLYVWKRNNFYKDIYVWVLFIFILLIRGPEIFLYFLIWLLGVISYFVSSKYEIKIDSKFIIVILLVLMFVNHLIQFLNIFHLHEYFRDFFWGIIISIAFVFDFKNSIKSNLVNRLLIFNRYMADFSFSLYAFHLPLMYILVTCFYEIPLLRDFSYYYVFLIVAILIYFATIILYNISEAYRYKYKEVIIILLRFLEKKKYA